MLRSFLPERVVFEPSCAFIVLALLAMGDAYSCLLFFLACFIHECGHLLCSGLCRRRIRSLSLSASGAKIALAGNLGSYKKDIAVALSGSAANFLTCVLMRAFLPVFGKAEVFFFFSNLLLGAVNLLWVGELDGAVALESALCAFFDPIKAEGLMRITGALGIVILLLLGVGVMVITGGNFSLLLLWLGIMAKNKKDRQSGLFR